MRLALGYSAAEVAILPTPGGFEARALDAARVDLDTTADAAQTGLEVLRVLCTTLSGPGGGVLWPQCEATSGSPAR